MKKALMDATVATMIYRFNIGNIEELQNMGYQVDVSCNLGEENPSGEGELSAFLSTLKERNVQLHRTDCPRNPFSLKKILTTYWQMKRLANSKRYKLIHTQTPISGAICRLAFRKARKEGTNVIYAAHGFHFYRGAPLKNWLLFYPVEKLCSRFTDVLITINQEDFLFAQKKMKSRKIVYVPGVGIDLNKYSPLEGQSSSARERLRKSIGCTEADTLLLSVGELNTNKNHKVVVEAIADLHNQQIHYAIAGSGEQEAVLLQQAAELGISEQVHLLGFRMNVSDWYHAADIFILPSRREGLPASMMEAMASGLPCIGSRIRGNMDLIDDGKGGYLVDAESSEDFADRISKLVNERESAVEMGRYNRQKIIPFRTEAVQAQMREIYQSLQAAAEEEEL